MSHNWLTPYLSTVFADSVRRESVARIVVGILRRSALVEQDAERYEDWISYIDELSVNGADHPGCQQFLSEIEAGALDHGLIMPAILRSYAAYDREIQRRSARHWLARSASESSSSVDQALITAFVGSRYLLGTCDVCGDHYLTGDLEDLYDGGRICTTCREDGYLQERGGRWIREDESREAVDCDGHSCIIHEDDAAFYYSEDHDAYVHQNYRPQPPPVIRGYHNSKPYFMAREDEWSLEHGRLFGVELEVECVSRDPEDVAAALHAEVNGGEFARAVFFEQDGSLNSGFEMITQPMSLPGLRNMFGFLRDKPELLRGVRSHKTDSCGLHVHVGRSGLSNLTIARCVTFVNDPGNDAFIQALARRYNTGYCRVVEKSLDTAHLPGDRREAVNLTNRDTIEFRIFRGSLKYEAVVAAVEFCHAILEYCARADIQAGALNARAFLSWCATDLEGETRVLRAYVDQRTAGTFRHLEAA